MKSCFKVVLLGERNSSRTLKPFEGYGGRFDGGSLLSLIGALIKG